MTARDTESSWRWMLLHGDYLSPWPSRSFFGRSLSLGRRGATSNTELRQYPKIKNSHDLSAIPLTAPENVPLPPRRRWLQFGIGTMLLLTALVACSVAWVGTELRFVHQRR